jgi:hypothetical protein
MDEANPVSKNHMKRDAKKSAREATKARNRAIMLSMKAMWQDEDADSYNLLDDAMQDRESAAQLAWSLYSVASQALHDAARAADEDPEALLKRYLGGK